MRYGIVVAWVVGAMFAATSIACSGGGGNGSTSSSSSSSGDSCECVRAPCDCSGTPAAYSIVSAKHTSGQCPNGPAGATNQYELRVLQGDMLIDITFTAARKAGDAIAFSRFEGGRATSNDGTTTVSVTKNESEVSTAGLASATITVNAFPAKDGDVLTLAFESSLADGTRIAGTYSASFTHADPLCSGGKL